MPKGFQPGNNYANNRKGYKAPHTLLASKMREKLVAEVNKKLPELLKATFDLALGHFFEETDREGNRLVYLKSPDANSIQYLINQVVGKAKESLELDNPKEREAIQELSEQINQMIKNDKLSRK